MRCTSWRTTGVQMKIILNQQEVLDIVLASVKNRIHEPFNEIVLEKYSDDNFVTIRYVEPTFEEPSDET
jgi:hypothetical protein